MVNAEKDEERSTKLGFHQILQLAQVPEILL